VRGFIIAAAAAAMASPAYCAEPPAVVQQRVWRPEAGVEQVPLWPEGYALDRPEVDGPEAVEVGGAIGGRAATAVHNVTRPTLSIYPAKGRNTGAAVIVFPGGGYKILAIDLEGTEVCGWLTPQGITCGVLKYRVPQTWWPHDGHGQRPPKVQMALEDAQRAIGLLRSRAKRLGIDPHKVGVLGFSAGGHIVAAVSNAEARVYAVVDAADRESAHPDFAVALYPGHLWSGEGMALYPFDPISPKAPPTFLLQAEDDPVDDVRHSVAYFLALREAKVPAELHIYPTGGHAFGLRKPETAIGRWPTLVEAWLRGLGILPAR
jgi:acetyl esterase/lipase